MTPIKPDDQAPDVERLLEALESHHILYILTGSVAAQFYGVAIQPGDLDITPALDLDNLARLCKLLVEIEATLPDTEEIGRWEVRPDGERKWISRKATPEERLQRARWAPKPDDLSTLDHLFHTKLGNLDIVPDLTGDYERLVERAKLMNVHGLEVLVAHVDELLSALTVPRRKKDVARVRQLRTVQRQLHRPTPNDS